MRQVHIHHFKDYIMKPSKAINLPGDKARTRFSPLCSKDTYRRVTEALTGLVSYISLDNDLIDFIDYFV
jgi:hypothetical protein